MSSALTVIKHNRLVSAGIEYAEDGASTTTVDGNYISLAPEDGISAHGNSLTQPCVNNIVINNVIENAGFIGVEDWGNIQGTLISNNTITGTGKDPSQIGGGMGISAVGRNATVSNNTITNAVLYYIESGGSKKIINNVLNDTQGIATGIILNFTAPASPDLKLPTVVSGNIINNCNIGILIFGNYSPAATLAVNTLNNPVSIGISFDSSSPDYNINILNNKVNLTVPNKNLRTAYGTYTSLAQRTTNQLITFDGNTATYAATAAGGVGLDKGFVIATDNTIINANTVYGNFIFAGKSLVYAITGDTNPAKEITLTNNRFYSATINLKDFSFKSKYGNNFN